MRHTNGRRPCDRAALEELRDGRSAVGGQIRNLGVYVPRRFLALFFEVELRGRKNVEKNRLIERLAEEAFTDEERPCLYRFVTDGGCLAIEFHPGWYGYFRTHARILQDFCLWNLLLYVQKNNPSVTNLAAKLFERGSALLGCSAAAGLSRLTSFCRGATWLTTCCGTSRRRRRASTRPKVTGCRNWGGTLGTLPGCNTRPCRWW